MEPQKKLINSADSCVDETLLGLVQSSPGLVLLRGHRVVVRSDVQRLRGKVGLLSGGGAGHEPAHGGFVGAGMLAAAVAGGVFASPPPDSILAAILFLHSAGACAVLLIVKNYTGDRLNFGLALERARLLGVTADMVVTKDDCAFERPSKAGPRGLCGTIFIHKLAGAMAERGEPLDRIVSTVNEALRGIGTLGVSLSPCSVPGSGPTFQLPPGEMELGLGIHGEPGVKRSKVTSADAVVETMIDHMTNPHSQSHLPLKSGDSVVLCVNNLGALSCLELAVVTRAAISSLESRGVTVVRVMSGSFMTSLEMSGFSLSVMKTSPETLDMFDTRTSAPAWPNLSTASVSGRSYSVEPAPQTTKDQDHSEGPLSSVLGRVLDQVCLGLLQIQDELNRLDRASGDGDCGSTHAQAARALQEWRREHVTPGCPGRLLQAVGAVLQEKMGGSSGANVQGQPGFAPLQPVGAGLSVIGQLYSLFLAAAAGHVTEGRSQAADWARAVKAGTRAMQRHGGAEPGDRTMLDALCPASEELTRLSTAPPGDHMEILRAAVQKAALGAEATSGLVAKAGRASYISAERLSEPDPGAVAVSAIFNSVLQALERQG